MASCSLGLQVGRHYSSFAAAARIPVTTYRSSFAKTSQLKKANAIHLLKTDVDGKENGAATCSATVDSGTFLHSSSQNEWFPEDNGVGVGDEENVIVKKRTLRLVESAMLAATAGLAYFLSNLLRLEVRLYRTL